MSSASRGSGLTRRQWLHAMGRRSGGAGVYAAMSFLGLAEASTATPAFSLGEAPKGATVLVIGAGVAGLVSALELQRAGYQVQLLEYNDRPGGRSWTLRGGDRYTELGGATQHCQFDQGQYLNPGPWRLPYHHHGVLSYCKQLGVALEPFVQVNHNAYVHSTRSFGGQPQRWRKVQADFQGDVAELLAKVVQQRKLDEPLTEDDRERLLAALRNTGGLDNEMRYRGGFAASKRRGTEPAQDDGLHMVKDHEQPRSLQEMLDPEFWARMNESRDFEYQTPLFQPVGGMDAIPRALAKAVGPKIRYRARVTEISQDDHGVVARYEDLNRPGRMLTARAQWCVCTLPLSILSQLEIRVGDELRNAIQSVPYFAATKVGLQFKRRFWEEDEAIYGGISQTDLPIMQIGYPNYGFQGRKGVLLGAYTFGTNAYEFAAMSPAQRIRETVRLGTRIHKQYPAEFENGMAVAWHRSPFTLGCFGWWTEETRARHYPAMLKMDGRIILAGEHASLLTAWQEGAVLSARHAITQLHKKAVGA
ncbi:flavin monoamine oxidase family protein [Paucibacter sp. JuS9]|uniref:flavin monoamine oxidase family protein n=1 Tax=Paucibacter sp. JuS9 TaxID=3228748 RepID=UPI003756DC64